MSSYGSQSSTKTTVMVPAEFDVVPALSTILRTVDAFGAALVAPAPALPPVLPAGAVWSFQPPAQPNPVDRLYELHQHLISWHNQLVTAVRRRDENLTQLSWSDRHLVEARATLALRDDRIDALEAELVEQRRVNASQARVIEAQYQQIATLEAIAQEVRDAEASARKAAGRRSSRARKVAR